MDDPAAVSDIHPSWHRVPADPPPRPGRRSRRDRPRRCRVEHREGGTTTVLARGLLTLPHPSELTPFVTQLRRAGATGEVVLIDEADDAAVARRLVAPECRS